MTNVPACGCNGNSRNASRSQPSQGEPGRAGERPHVGPNVNAFTPNSDT